MSATRDWFYMLPPVDMGDRCLHVGPISHGSGYLFLPIFLAGGCNILAPKFDAVGFMKTLAEDRVAYCFAVATMVADIVARVGGKRQDLPGLKAIMLSAAPITAKTALAGREVFGETMYQMYGQTEAVPVTFMGPKEWFGGRAGSDPLVSAGRVMPFAELEIRDEENRSVPVGTAGEIAIRCEGQMTGIWNEPGLTAGRLRDGWVLTGDVGRLDENGFLYVIDRVADMIVSGGFNIWPAELEQVIVAMPGVNEVVVFGIPHEKWGETPCAEVILATGTELSERAVIDECAAKLGSYKPTKVVFRSEPFPRSPVGKLQRKVIREPYWAGHTRRVAGS